MFPRSRGGGSVTSQIGYRGQWTAEPPSPYMQNDIVILLTGANSGTYLNLTNNNSTSPALGVGWVQIAPGDAFGRWS